MVSALVKAAIAPADCWASAKHSNMRTVIVTEEDIISPPFAINRAKLKAWKSVTRRDPSYETEVTCSKWSQQWQAYLFLCCGLLLCSSFFIAICAVDQRTTEQVGSLRNGRSRKVHQHLSFTSGDSRIGDVAQGMKGNGKVSEGAYRGLGAIHRKGTKAMDKLIVVNLQEHCDERDVRLFLRTLHRSGALASADLALLFPWSNSVPQFVYDVLHQEEKSFQTLLASTAESKPPSSPASNAGNGSFAEFHSKAFRKSSSPRPANKNRSSIVWGDAVAGCSMERANWGSVVSFKMNELDPDNILSEFLTNPSSQLRRWVCYQMLLGVLRRSFRSAMLVELGGVAVLGDAFALLRGRDGLYLTAEDSTWADAMMECSHPHIEMANPSNGMEDEAAGTKAYTQRDGGAHAKKGRMMEMVYGREVWSGLDEGERERRVVSSRVIVGSLKHAKRLANSMVVEVVRVALHRSTTSDNTHAFPDKALLSYLLQRSPSLLGKKLPQNLHVLGDEDSLVHCVDDDNSNQAHASAGPRAGPSYSVLHANSLFGNLSLGGFLMAAICNSPSSPSPYPDCLNPS